MAWNEPGVEITRIHGVEGNKGKKQGPPDLDDAFRKLQDKLNGIFGGGSNGGHQSGRQWRQHRIILPGC